MRTGLVTEGSARVTCKGKWEDAKVVTKKKKKKPGQWGQDGGAHLKARGCSCVIWEGKQSLLPQNTSSWHIDYFKLMIFLSFYFIYIYIFIFIVYFPLPFSPLILPPPVITSLLPMSMSPFSFLLNPSTPSLTLPLSHHPALSL